MMKLLMIETTEQPIIYSTPNIPDEGFIGNRKTSFHFYSHIRHQSKACISLCH